MSKSRKGGQARLQPPRAKQHNWPETTSAKLANPVPNTINSRIDDLERAIEEVAKATAALGDRLSPVLREPGPAVSVEDALLQIQTDDSPLSIRLNGVYLSLLDVRDRLDEIFTRVQL